MLELEIQNCKRREDLCITIVDWFYKKYLIDYELEVIVEHKNLKKDCVYGYCDISPYEEDTWKPRSFLIEMEKTLTLDTYIQVLLHELYHVLQFCTGDLLIKDTMRHWKGTSIEGLEYEKQPHEIDAKENEQALYDSFMDYLEET
jgi:hypothetical protein